MRNNKNPILLISVCTLAISLTNAVFADDIQNNGHELDLKFRTLFFDRDYEKSENDRTQSAFGAEFNYRSPKIDDWVRVGISAYTVEELDSSGLVKTDVLSKKDGSLEGYGLFGQAYVEITPNKNSSIKLGRQKTKSILLSSSGSRAVPSTYQGASGEIQFAENLLLYGSIYDEWSLRTSDDFQGFATDTSDEGTIEYVSVLGAKYETGPYILEGEYLNSKDYISKYALRGSYALALAEDSELIFTGGYFTSSDDGDLFVTGSEGGDLDDEDTAGSEPGVTKSSNDGQGVLVQVAWEKNKTTLTAAVSKFDDLWLEDNFTGDHGRNPFPTRATHGPDLSNANETAAVLKLEHDWEGTVNGLKSYIGVGKGWDAENSELGEAGGSADEDWVEAKLAYKVPALKGLKVTGKYYHYTADETGSVDGVKGDQDHFRLYIDYGYKFK